MFRDNNWVVLCEGYAMQEFDNLEDAEDFASMWNAAYPTPEYSEFTVAPLGG